jgi:hypothetical protein
MDHTELRRGNKVMFISNIANSTHPEVGKIVGVPDREFPYLFEVKTNDGSRQIVNSDRIFMKLP